MTYKLLQEIASDNSKLHKIAVINREALAGNDEFFAGLRYALDNIDTFGVKKVPIRTDEECGSGSGLPFHAFKVLADALIKRELTGHAALAEIDNAMRCATTNEWNNWYRLILTKDLKSGFSETTLNKAVKDVNPLYIVPTTPYMRCTLPAKSNMENWKWEDGIYSQTKADGMFSNVNINKEGYLWITSRGGTLFPTDCLEIEDQLCTALKPDTQTHGELTIHINGIMQPREIGNGILNSLSSGGSLEPNHKVVFDCWDQIPLSAAVPKGKYEVPYKERFNDLKSQVTSANQDGVRLTETRIVYSLEESRIHYKEHRARKLEGTINKSGEAFWKDGTSKDQVKQKEEIDVELRIKGFNPGKGKNAALFGSIQCFSECGLLETNVSGMSDDKRKEIHANMANLIDTIITVRSNTLMAPSKGKKSGLWSMFLPRLIEERPDKMIADTLEEIQLQFAEAEACSKPLEEEIEE